jgi:hypothetical protein
VTGVVFLISFSICSFYRKATDFCILILYSTTLLTVFMIAKSLFFVELVGSFGYNITSALKTKLPKESINDPMNKWANELNTFQWKKYKWPIST